MGNSDGLPTARRLIRHTLTAHAHADTVEEAPLSAPFPLATQGDTRGKTGASTPTPTLQTTSSYRPTMSSPLQARLARFLPLESLFAYFDLKLGSEIITYFCLFNKVAGFYGLLAIFFGGNALFLDQLLLYLYNIASIGGIVWGLRGIWDESAPQTLLYAHLYSIDHIVSTLSTLYFAVHWYVYNPHDGRRVANSEAQQAIVDGLKAASGVMGIDLSETADDTDAERAAKAHAIWDEERGFSTFVLVAGWLIKIYFILTLYSYAHHLRRGTWRQLVASQQAAKGQNSAGTPRRASSALNGGYSHLRTTSVASTAFSGNGSATENGGGPGRGDVLWEEDEEGEFENERRLPNGHGQGHGKGSGSSSSGTAGAVVPAAGESADGQGDIGTSFSPRMSRVDSINGSRKGSTR